MSLYRVGDIDAPQNFVPGGFFFGWLIENGGQGAGVDAAISAEFLSRRRTGPELFAAAGGVLDADSIARDFYPFARFYVHPGDGGLFLDMAEWFPVPSIYDVRDTWHNYEWMRILFVERYSEWRASV